MGAVKVDDRQFQQSVREAIFRLERDSKQTVREAALETRNQAVSRTPVDTGLLRSGWNFRESADIGDRFVCEVSNLTPYANAVEYGTRAHTITARNKSVLADKSGQVFGTTVSHPGTRPRPMLRTAVQSVVPRLVERLRRLI